MRKLLLVSACAVAVLLILGAVILLDYQGRKKAAEKIQQQHIAKKETPTFDWPYDARFATCSQDGRTVAFMSGREIVVVRDGKELFRDKKVNALHPRMKLSPDGSRFAVHCMWRGELLLLDTTTRKEVLTTKIPEIGRRIAFSPSGDQMIITCEWDEPKRFDTFADARQVKTEAICSGNGRVVAITSGVETEFVREGKSLSKTITLSGAKLNQNGSRLIGYDNSRNALVLLDTDTGKEVISYPATDKAVYDFTADGETFGLLEPGASEMVLYWVWKGERRVTLPATYTYRSGIDGELVTINYTLARFYFCQWRPTDPELTVEMISLTREGEKAASRIQWSPIGFQWINVEKVYGPLDQHYDFNPDGTLTEEGKRQR